MRKIFLNDSLEKEFQEDGVVQIPMLTSEELNYFATQYSDSYDLAKDVFHSTMFIKDPQYRKKTDEMIRGVMCEKLNKLIIDYRLLFCNFIVKQSSSESSVGIHQDWNFTSPDHTSLNIWIPLVDIDELTGTFYALKGSHKTFQNIRYTPYADNAYKDIEQYILERSTAYHPKAGEAIVYNGALVHYSRPNISGRLRVVIGMALIPKEAPNLHYYKRNTENSILEVYEANEAFYNSFDFYEEPKGVKKVAEISDYKSLPSGKDLQ